MLGLLGLGFLGFVVATAHAGGRGYDWGVKYELPGCDKTATDLGLCFKDAHEAVFPCLMAMFKHPNYLKCKTARRQRMYESWKELSSQWHKRFAACMGQDLAEHAIEKRQTGIEEFDVKECFEGVKSQMMECERKAVLTCPKYKECMQDPETMRIRELTQKFKAVNSATLQLCLAQPDLYLAMDE